MSSLPPLPAPPPGRDEVEHAPVVPEEEPSSRWPVVAALLGLLIVGGGVVALLDWVLGGPTVCEEGSFTSDRFGYCTQVPSGWEAAAATDDEVADRFLRPTDAGTILVTAVPVSDGQDLERFADYVRGLDTEAGATVGKMNGVEVAGVEAVMFDVTAGAEDDATRSREVVFLRDGSAWRVQLADASLSFDASTRALDELLEGWVFV
jgi:hypothetical protein